MINVNSDNSNKETMTAPIVKDKKSGKDEFTF